MNENPSRLALETVKTFVQAGAQVIVPARDVNKAATNLKGLRNVTLETMDLMDPASNIQTPLMGELFQLMGTLVIIAAGLDRILLASLVRSFHAVPLGHFAVAPGTTAAIVRAAAGIFLAGVELAAPVLAATMLVEVALSLMGRLSPQLPVMNLTVPIKTITGLLILVGSLALWPHFVEARFAGLLDMAERLIAGSGQGLGAGT